MANALDNVQQTFTTLQTQYSLLRIACGTDDDKISTLATQYATAQANYFDCAEQTLSDDDVEVAALSKTLADQNKILANSVEEMGGMSKVIDAITDALTTGAALIKRAGL